MGLSGLNSHRKKYHFIQHSTCPNCTHPHENEEHLFFDCRTYAAHRQALLAGLGRLLPDLQSALENINLRKNKRNVMKLMIFGTKKTDIDKELFNTVAHFLVQIKRFDRREN